MTYYDIVWIGERVGGYFLLFFMFFVIFIIYFSFFLLWTANLYTDKNYFASENILNCIPNTLNMMFSWNFKGAEMPQEINVQ